MERGVLQKNEPVKQKPNTVLSLVLRFNHHFPGGPGLADTRMSPFWIYITGAKDDGGGEW